MQKRHGTQQWRDFHPSGRSLRNTVSGQLKENKKIISDNYCVSLQVSRIMVARKLLIRLATEHCCGKICASRLVPHNL